MGNAVDAVEAGDQRDLCGSTGFPVEFIGVVVDGYQKSSVFGLFVSLSGFRENDENVGRHPKQTDFQNQQFWGTHQTSHGDDAKLAQMTIDHIFG